MKHAYLLSLLVCLGCDDDGGGPSPDAGIAEGIFAVPGQPRPSATPEERATFERGEQVATRRFGPAEGLGPRFNVTFCAGCHEKPVFGGAAGHYRDFYIVGQTLDDGSFIDVEGTNNGVLDSFNAAGGRRPQPAPEANTFALRNPIPFFGVGLIAELPEDVILAHADPDDADGDGVSGRPNFDQGFVGRFGMKSQTVSIEGFIRGPLNNHLGITTNPLTAEQQAALPVPSVAEDRDDPPIREASAGLEAALFHQAAAPAEPLVDSDDVADPEMSGQDLFDLVAWSMLLGAPLPDAPTELTERGRALFSKIQCTACHVPALAGPRGAVPLYSDLLLHDMGPELADGITMGVATASEFRTAPLWGVGVGAPFLHDGRAFTLERAIELHGGEGTGARDRWLALSADEQAAVIAFLESLGGSSVKTDGRILPDDPVPGVGETGGPTRILTDDEQAIWARGRAVFDRDHGFEHGLGPLFNGDSCRACHFDPIVGGAGSLGVNVMRFGKLDGNVFTPPAGGTLLHRFAAHGPRPEAADENVFEMRQTPTTLGMGVLDRVPPESIVANADPEDADSDGIQGIAHILADGRLGRFGWKAQVPSTLEFVGDAMGAELGLTLPEAAGARFAKTTDDDDVPDPELSLEDTEALEFFLNQQSPPRPEVDEVGGRTLFTEIGCADCHVPQLAGSDGDVPAYTDLLLHVIAEDGTPGIGDGEATPLHFRTPPLWGLRFTAPYLHDGSAATAQAAIDAHHAEAEISRQAFEALAADQQAAVIRFLETL